MKYFKNINFYELSFFLSIVLLVISLTRIWAISLFYIFANNPEFIEKFSNDRWHHYQVGLLIVTITYLLRKVIRTKITYAIGVGIFLEEWPVFLNDLGFNTNRLYHTKFDFITIMGITSLIYILFRVLARKYNQA